MLLFAPFPDAVEDRWVAINAFLNRWHGPREPSGVDTKRQLDRKELELGLRLPEAFRTWHVVAGSQLEKWSAQDSMVSVDALRVSDDDAAIIIRTENQYCERWGIRLVDMSLADPPVYAFEEGERLECATVTEFAALTLLLETMWNAPLLLSNEEDGLEMSHPGVPEALKTTNLPKTYWVFSPVQVFVGEDVFLVSTPGDGFAYLAARSEYALRRLPAPFLKQFVRTG